MQLLDNLRFFSSCTEVTILFCGWVIKPQWLKYFTFVYSCQDHECLSKNWQFLRHCSLYSSGRACHIFPETTLSVKSQQHPDTHKATDQRCVSQPQWVLLTPQWWMKKRFTVILTSPGFACLHLTGWDRGNWCHIWFCQLGQQVTRDGERQKEIQTEIYFRAPGVTGLQWKFVFHCDLKFNSSVVC